MAKKKLTIDEFNENVLNTHSDARHASQVVDSIVAGKASDEEIDSLKEHLRVLESLNRLNAACGNLNHGYSLISRGGAEFSNGWEFFVNSRKELAEALLELTLLMDASRHPFEAIYAHALFLSQNKRPE